MLPDATNTWLIFYLDRFGEPLRFVSLLNRRTKTQTPSATEGFHHGDEGDSADSLHYSTGLSALNQQRAANPHPRTAAAKKAAPFTPGAASFF